jgi:hypothetical protein
MPAKAPIRHLDIHSFPEDEKLWYHRRLVDVTHITLQDHYDDEGWLLSRLSSVLRVFPSLTVLKLTFFDSGMELLPEMLHKVSNLAELEELSIVDPCCGWYPDLKFINVGAWSTAMNAVLSRCNKLHTLHVSSLQDMDKLMSSSVKCVICQAAYPGQMKKFRSTLCGFSALNKVVFQRISVMPVRQDASAQGMSCLEYFDTVWLPSLQDATAEFVGGVACLSTDFMLSGCFGENG